jgi:hypothetical protein
MTVFISAYTARALGSICQPCQREFDRRIEAGISAIKSSEDVQNNIKELGMALAMQGVPEADAMLAIYSAFNSTFRALREIKAGDEIMGVARLVNTAANIWEDVLLAQIEETTRTNIPLPEIQNLAGSIIGAFSTGFIMG